MHWSYVFLTLTHRYDHSATLSLLVAGLAVDMMGSYWVHVCFPDCQPLKQNFSLSSTSIENWMNHILELTHWGLEKVMPAYLYRWINARKTFNSSALAMELRLSCTNSSICITPFSWKKFLYFDENFTEVCSVEFSWQGHHHWFRQWFSVNGDLQAISHYLNQCWPRCRVASLGLKVLKKGMLKW